MVSAAVVRHGVLRVRYRDGLHGEIDVLEQMWGPVFARARTPDGFAEGRFDDDARTVVWPGDVDLAPDTLYLRLHTGHWPAGHC